MNLLIKSARIIDTNSKYHKKIMDIFIKDGKIEKIAKSIKSCKESLKAGKEIEFSDENLHVSTGWMDMHSNFREPGFEYKDDLETGIKSAIKGGFTSVLLMPQTEPVIDTKSHVEYIKNNTKGNVVDVHTSGSITKKIEGNDLVEMHDMNSVNCRTFTDDKKSVNRNEVMKLALLYSKDFGGLIMNYPNDKSIANGGTMNEGISSTNLGLKGISSIAEEIMVDRDLNLAKYTEGNLHLSYISTKESVNKIKRAKKEGVNITADVSINNLVMTDEKVKTFDTRYKVLPPLRTKKDNTALIKGLKNGTIDVICSDHSPEDEENKKTEFDNAAFGILGLETLFGLLGKHLSNDLTLEEIVEKISTNPRLIALKEELKIEEGQVANITLFNPDIEWEVTKSDIKSKSRNTPFVGETLKGKALAVYNNNQFIFID
ncbi:MAG: dihydroorotase [Flavobacteriales bacterium]